jgi:hypothetical protein
MQRAQRKARETLRCALDVDAQRQIQQQIQKRPPKQQKQAAATKSKAAAKETVMS